MLGPHFSNTVLHDVNVDTSGSNWNINWTVSFCRASIAFLGHAASARLQYTDAFVLDSGLRLKSRVLDTRTITLAETESHPR